MLLHAEYTSLSFWGDKEIEESRLGISMCEDVSGRTGRREAAVGDLFSPVVIIVEAVTRAALSRLRLNGLVVEFGCGQGSNGNQRVLRLLSDTFESLEAAQEWRTSLAESLRL